MEEIRTLRSRALPGLNEARAQEALKHWLQREVGALPECERASLHEALHSSRLLRTIYAMRQDLTALWSNSAASKEQLVKQLEDWCRRADESGIDALQEFSRKAPLLRLTVGRHQLTFGMILLIVLILLLIGVIPAWPHSRGGAMVPAVVLGWCW